jgi:predicted RNA-binding protein
MKTESVFVSKKSRVSLFALFALLVLPVCLPSQADTTVVVDENNRVVQVSQNQPQMLVVQEVPTLVTQTVVAQPVIVTTVDNSADFEGEIEKIDRAAGSMEVIDTEGRSRQVFINQATMDYYRSGDYVRIHPIAGTREVTFVRGESNRYLEGRITRVDLAANSITVHDTRGRDKKIDLKQGMVTGYKVDDYVRIHLAADLKEAKMIRTIKS